MAVIKAFSWLLLWACVWAAEAEVISTGSDPAALPVAESQRNDVLDESQEATVGKLFKYFLPKKFAQDKRAKIKVVEVGAGNLPDWLEIDQTLGALVGVPAPQDHNRHFKLQLTGQQDAADTALGHLSIHVSHDNIHTSNVSNFNAKEVGEMLGAVKCPPGSSVTQAAVAIDANANHMNPLSKARVVEALRARLGLPEGLLKLLPAQEGKPLVDTAAALVSGIGDVNGVPQHPGVILQWEVGCGNVRPEHIPVLQTLENAASAKDGQETLGSSLGHTVVGWHVLNDRSRVRRRVRHKKPKRKHKESEEYSGFYEPDPDITRSKAEHEEDREGSGFFSTDAIITEKPSTAASQPVVISTQPHTTTSTSTTTTTVSTTTVTTTTSPTTSSTTETTTTRRTRRPRPTPSPETSSATTSYNYPPQLNNPLPMRQTIAVGMYYGFKIPSDLFTDAEDGDTRRMNLMLTWNNGEPLPQDSWLKLDNARQVLYGFPTKADQGKYSYELVVIDSKGKKERCFFEIIIEYIPPSDELTHEVRTVFDIDYSRFITDVDQRLDLASKLANAFGDGDMTNLNVLRVEQGSVVYVWTNNSLKSQPGSPCQEEEIDAMLAKMVDPKTQEIQPTFRKSLEPYEVLDVGYKKMGSCKMVVPPVDPASSEVPAKSTAPPSGGVQSKPNESSDNSLFVATVVPAVIIAVLLLVAAILACYLYRRKRKGSHDVDPAMHVRKGAPVIFADELEEPQDSSRTPLMLPEEKPPQPPPEYPRSNSGSLAPTASPPTSHRGDLDRSRDDLYNRPPPFYSDSYAATPNMAGPPPPPPYAHIPP